MASAPADTEETDAHRLLKAAAKDKYPLEFWYSHTAFPNGHYNKTTTKLICTALFTEGLDLLVDESLSQCKECQNEPANPAHNFKKSWSLVPANLESVGGFLQHSATTVAGLCNDRYIKAQVRNHIPSRPPESKAASQAEIDKFDNPSTELANKCNTRAVDILRKVHDAHDQLFNPDCDDLMERSSFLARIEIPKLIRKVMFLGKTNAEVKAIEEKNRQILQEAVTQQMAAAANLPDTERQSEETAVARRPVSDGDAEKRDVQPSSGSPADGKVAGESDVPPPSTQEAVQDTCQEQVKCETEVEMPSAEVVEHLSQGSEAEPSSRSSGEGVGECVVPPPSSTQEVVEETHQEQVKCKTEVEELPGGQGTSHRAARGVEHVETPSAEIVEHSSQGPAADAESETEITPKREYLKIELGKLKDLRDRHFRCERFVTAVTTDFRNQTKEAVEQEEREVSFDASRLDFYAVSWERIHRNAGEMAVDIKKVIDEAKVMSSSCDPPEDQAVCTPAEVPSPDKEPSPDKSPDKEPSPDKEQYPTKPMLTISQKKSLGLIRAMAHYGKIALQAVLTFEDLDLYDDRIVPMAGNPSMQHFLGVVYLPIPGTQLYYMAVFEVLTPSWMTRCVWERVSGKPLSQGYMPVISKYFDSLREKARDGAQFRVLLPASNYVLPLMNKRCYDPVEFQVIPDCLVDYYLGHVIYLLNYFVNCAKRHQLNQIAHTICVLFNEVNNPRSGRPSDIVYQVFDPTVVEFFTKYFETVPMR